MVVDQRQGFHLVQQVGRELNQMGGVVVITGGDTWRDKQNHNDVRYVRAHNESYFVEISCNQTTCYVRFNSVNARCESITKFVYYFMITDNDYFFFLKL